MTVSTCHRAATLIPLCLDESLSSQEAAELQAHLDSCADCRRALELAAASDEEWAALSQWSGQPRQSNSHPSEPLFEETEEFAASVSDFAIHYLAPTSAPDAVGQLDDIEILDIVGRGGMGIVVKGRQTSLNRLVAVKLLRPDLAQHPLARKRFTREAQATAAVVHPNVMPIHAIRTSGRLPYLVMPFLDCESLEQRLSREGALNLTDTLAIGLQVARALEAAHAQGLVHRDVKPGNILLERTGPRVWLADFGLARALDDISLTRSGVIAGTPQFMSPEQARGEPIDARSDLFSLGSVLYTLCTGRPPYRAETAYGVLRKIVESPARSIRDLEPAVPEWLERYIGRLHAKDPAERPAGAAAVADWLERALRAVQQPNSHAVPSDSEADGVDTAADEAPSSLSLTQLTFAFLGGGLLMLLSLSAMVLAWPLLSEPAVEAPPTTVAEERFVEDANFAPPTLLAQTDPAPATPSSPKSPQDQPAKAPTTESKYASAREAMAAASGFLAIREYAKSREPLEEALKLADDDQLKVRIYRSLIPAYTQAAEWEPKVNALEFIMRHSESVPERSLARTELLGFVRQRGKTKEVVQRYEQQLKADPSDETTLFILAEVYARLTDEPKKAADILERLTKIKSVSGQELSVAESAQLAAQYVKSRKYAEGAELFEKTASRDAALAAWHYKEAATAWMSAKNKERALAAAKASAAAAPEQRSAILEYFWHRNLGDVFSDAGEPALAIPHYEQALAKTTIDGYRKETEQRLARARELAK